MNLDLKWMGDLNGFRNVNSRSVKLLTSIWILENGWSVIIHLSYEEKETFKVTYSRAPFSSVLHVRIDNTLESNTDHSSIAFN